MTKKRNRLKQEDYPNVDIKDYKQLTCSDGKVLYKYRTSCGSCGSDRGYVILSNRNKSCRSCSNISRNKVEPRPGLHLGLYIYKDSRRHFKMTCVECLDDRGYQRASEYKSGLCRSCSAKNTHSGKTVSNETKLKLSKPKNYKNGHPWLGKTHTEETKSIISQKQKTYCENYGNQFEGRSHSNKTISKISMANSGKEPKWKGRVFTYSGPKGLIKMRSSYELFYAKWMDANNIDWEYEPLYKLSSGLYFSPDFKVNGHDIIEIKGFWTEKAKEKWLTFCKDNPDINKKVLMKEDLEKLGMN